MDDGEYRAFAAIESLFAAARHIKVAAVEDGVRLSDGERSWRLHPVWVGEGFPQDIRPSLEPASRPRDGVTVLVGRRMSSGSRKVLSDLGQNWMDLDGNADIQSPGLYVKTGRAERASKAPKVFRWTRSSGAVAEVLLEALVRSATDAPMQAEGELKRVQAISEVAGWSQAQVGKILQQFDSEGYTEKIGSQRGANALRVLRAPSRLLSDWAGWYRKLHVESVGFTGEMRDPISYIRRAEDLVGRHSVVVSGWPALESYAPYLTSVPSTLLYVDGADLDSVRDRFKTDVNLRQVESGARLTVALAEHQVLRLAHDQQGSFCVVSPIRLYGDLLRAGIRGEDAAGHLREASIGF